MRGGFGVMSLAGFGSGQPLQRLLEGLHIPRMLAALLLILLVLVQLPKKDAGAGREVPLAVLKEGDVFLNRFSPTGFYSSAVNNGFIQALISAEYSTMPTLAAKRGRTLRGKWRKFGSSSD